VPVSALYACPERRSHYLRTQKRFAKNSLAPEDFSAQDRSAELKLIQLEPSGHKDFEYVRKNFLACLQTKRHRKMSKHFIHSLCKEISVCVQSGVLTGETSARAPDRRT
jgi:hypothetical protein